jgi:hypothetical protein
MTAQVASHDFVVLLQFHQLKLPIFVRAEKAVHEHQGRGAAPLADEMQA